MNKIKKNFRGLQLFVLKSVLNDVSLVHWLSRSDMIDYAISII